jgi:hypothetical protein
MTAVVLSFRSFGQERPPVAGYLYHGSPRRHLRLNERRFPWEPFYATDSHEAAHLFATNDVRSAGTIHYVKPTGPYWTLVEDDVSRGLGAFTSYIFARADSVRIVPLREVYGDYLQDLLSPGERDTRLPPGRRIDAFPTPTQLRAEGPAAGP